MGWEGQTSSAKSWAGIVDPESYTGLVEPGGVIAGSCDRKPGKEEVLLLKTKCSQGSFRLWCRRQNGSTAEEV